jgi:hypothetical protein
MYPIAILVQATMAERGFSRGKLAVEMGYRNVSKALRRFDAFVAGEETTPEFRPRLTAALDIEPDQFEQALEATRTLQCDEARQRDEAEIAAARAAFRPHLRVIPERRVPEPIFVAAFTGVDFWLVEPLPEDLLLMSAWRQLHTVVRIARAHFRRTKGRVGPFGAICGYLFRTKFEKAIRLDVEGNVRGIHHGRIPESHASLWVGHRQIPQGLLGQRYNAIEADSMHH